MDKYIKLLAVAKGNWKALVVVFLLGGIGSVAGVLGIDPLQTLAEGKIVQVAAPIVSATTVE